MAVVPAGLATALHDRYRLDRELGQGGMATVYLAHDMRHPRLVAVKVLRPELGAVIGPDRFLAEIRTTATLQHPHILPLLDSGQADGLLYYVMPFVEGESLRDRLKRERQLPVEEAIRIAIEVATAMDYAHRHNVIHRDLKPENILLQDGQALVADFGIALAVSTTAGDRLTSTGLSVGTPAYMSPEQAAGERTLDSRSDIYALGCVLYEALAGEVPFPGPTIQAITARKLSQPIPSLSAVRGTVSAGLEEVITRALARVPADRFGSGREFADALRAVERPGATPVSAPSAAVARPPDRLLSGSRLPWLLAGAAVTVAGVLVVRGARTPDPTGGQVVSLTLTTPPDQHLTAEREPDPIRITRDGSTFIFLGRGRTGPHLLYRRDLADPEPRPIPGTEDAHAPFLAPDGGSVGFFRQGRLYRVSLTGGDPSPVADSASWGALGAWSDDGWIYFVSRQGKLVRVAERGGQPEVLHAPDAEGNRLLYPAPLPGGRGLLFSQCTPGCNNISLHLIDLRSHQARRLLEAAGRAWYLPIGLLLYRPAGSAEIAALPFDLERLAIIGAPVIVLDHVGQTHNTATADAAFDISTTGTAVYLPGEAVALRAVVQHREDGTESALIEDRRGFLFPRVSPDGRSLVVEVHSLVHSTVDGDIWIYDLKSGSSRRLAAEGHATRPAWSPDGRGVAFTSWVGDSTGVYIQSADGGPAIRLRDGGYRIDGGRQVSWTPDMRWVIAAPFSDSTKHDIMALSTDTSQPPRMIRQTAANEVPGPVSRDGRWLSYESDETGRSELYLQSMAGGPGWPVSTDGAVDPVWPMGGAELYYLSGPNLVVARLDLGGVPRVLSRRTLPWPAIEDPSGNSAQYDILPNGDVLLLRTQASEQEPVVLLNWFEELRQKTRR